MLVQRLAITFNHVNGNTDENIRIAYYFYRPILYRKMFSENVSRNPDPPKHVFIRFCSSSLKPLNILQISRPIAFT